MQPTTRSHRQTPDFEDMEEDDLPEGGMTRQAGKEKTKQLGLDLLGRWHWIALGLILGLLGGFYYLAKAPKMYSAQTTLLIKQQTTSVMARDHTDEMDLRSLEALNTVLERIMRPELLRKVASRPELRAMPGLMPKAAEWLPGWAAKWFSSAKNSTAEDGGAPSSYALAGAISTWTKISVRKGTRLLDISVTHTSPAVAKAVADSIAVEYQAELTGARSSGRSSALQILVEESESARKRLETAQNAMANYQQALVTLKDLETKEANVTDLSRRYRAKHPRLITAEFELADLQKRFLTEFESARSSSSDRDFWESHASEWKQAGENDSAKVSTARRLLLSLGNVLSSEISSQNTVYNSILTRIQEADINQQQVESEMEISSLAQLPSDPVSPVAAKVLALGSGGGLGFGLLLAFFFIRLDNKIHTVAQLERETGIPALAAIAEIPAKALPAIAGKDNAADAAGNDARQRWSPLLMFREGVSTSTFAEMFRILRASVSLLGNEQKRRITLFTSALPGEGKTMVSSNFALAAAQQGKRTLLVDLDLRKPAMHKVFGLDRDTHPVGASEILTGQAKFEDGIYKDTGDEHLHIMLAGKMVPNPGELLNTSTLEELLQFAVANYDLVVVDSAPLLAVPDTRIIAPLVDNFCLVVRANFVPKGAVRRAISMLDNDQTHVSGVVFNGFTEKRHLMGENYSYGNYQTNRYGQAYRYGYGSYGASYGSERKK